MAVEPHPEFAQIGQELTAGMSGLTWQGRSNLGVSSTRSTRTPAHNKPGGLSGGKPPAGYGELRLGDFSADEAREAAEEAVREAQRAADRENPYAVRPSHVRRDAAASSEGKEQSSWDIAGREETADEAAENSEMTSAANGGSVSDVRETAATKGAHKGSWDLILCSFSFAEKLVDKSADARHLNEVDPHERAQDSHVAP